MALIRTLGAWGLAGLIAYVLAAISSQTVVLAQLVGLDVDIPFGTWLASTADAVIMTWALLLVILLGFAIAFAIAHFVKKMLPALGWVAYPLAGAAALAAALELMKLLLNVYPVLGAQTSWGYAMLVVAGGIGGIAYEIGRHRPSTGEQDA